MKSARSLIWGSVIAATATATMGSVTTAQAIAPYDEPVLVRAMTAASAPGVVSPAPADSPAAAAIRQAADPSSAIAAYGSALRAAPGDLSVKHAFVQRMIDFGLPEMVDAQAQELIKSDPRDGLAWAVSAYMNAKRDQTDMAFRDIAQAVKYQPGSTFVVRTAAQLVAWYDTQVDRQKTVPDDAKASLESIRRQFAGDTAFADAYASASQTYRQMATANATPTQQPASPPAAQTPPEYESQQPTYVNNYYTTYSAPYDGGYDYAYWYPSAYRPGFWWWPTFSSIVIINRDFDHHRRCDDLRFFAHHDRDACFFRHDVRDGVRVVHGRFIDPVRSRSGLSGPGTLGSPGTSRGPMLGQRDPRTPMVTSPPSAMRAPAPTMHSGSGSTATGGAVIRQPAITSTPSRMPSVSSPPSVVSTPRTAVRGPAMIRGGDAPRVSGFSPGGGRSTFSAAPSGGSRGMQGPSGSFRSGGSMSGGRSMR